MVLDYILRARAAATMRTSTVAMTEGEFYMYCANVIEYNYPKLRDINYDVWAYLNHIPDYVADPKLDPYEWWLATPIGPQSCSRDIADLRSALISWYTRHQEYRSNNGISVGLGDEWDNTLEHAIKTYQQFYPLYLVPTGYADMETLRRLRLVE